VKRIAMMGCAHFFRFKRKNKRYLSLKITAETKEFGLSSIHGFHILANNRRLRDTPAQRVEGSPLFTKK